MKFNINGVQIIVTEDETLVEGSVKVHTAEFEFDASWDEYTPIAVFKRGGELREQVIVDGKCEIPWEVLQKGLGGYLVVGVYGITDTKRRPTLWAAPKVVHPGTASGDKSREPTPDIAQQLVKMLNVGVEDIDGGHRVTFNDVGGEKSFDVMDGTSVAVASVTESEESGGTNTVEFTDGKTLKVKNGKDGEGAVPDSIRYSAQNLTDGQQRQARLNIGTEKETVSKYLTIPASAWKNDNDIVCYEKPMRIRVYAKPTTSSEMLSKVLFDGAEIFSVTPTWQKFTGTFTLADSVETLNFRVYGGYFEGDTKPDDIIQPYDISNVKVYRADDTSKTNLVSEDIAELNWGQYTSTDENDRLAVAYEEGLKYIHVFKQSSNTVSAAWTKMFNETADKFSAGDYIVEVDMRTTCNQLYCTLPLEGIRDASATTITPIKACMSVCDRRGVRGFGQKFGELSFTADTKPTEDITVAVSSTYGIGGSMVTVNTYDKYKDVFLVDDVESISAKAYEYNDSLVTVNLPKATYIDDYAFYNCDALTTVNLPKATAIGERAFYNCDALTTVNSPKASSIGGGAFGGCDALTTIDLPVAATIGIVAFYNCTALTTVNLPKASSIGDSAFYNCDALTTIDLPVAATIGISTFRDCDALTTVNLPKATYIDDYAFCDCDALTTIDLPKATTIGKHAFYGSRLKNLILRSANIATLGNQSALIGTNILGGAGFIYVPSALIEDYKVATNWTVFASRFRALEEYTVDGTTTGALDESKI